MSSPSLLQSALFFCLILGMGRIVASQDVCLDGVGETAPMRSAGDVGAMAIHGISGRRGWEPSGDVKIT